MAQTRKFQHHQEFISASSLAGHILSLAKDKSFMIIKDVDESKMESLAFDSGYLSACNDILFILMLDPNVAKDNVVEGETEMPGGEIDV